MDLVKVRDEGKKWLRRVAVGTALLVVVGSSLYTLFALKFSYSTGERVGFVQKLSKKGWMCKTNEGELAMVNMAGQQAEKFFFTVRDDAVAQKIESFAGHRVSLKYEEHRGIPSTCFGDTQYFVTDASKTD